LSHDIEETIERRFGRPEIAGELDFALFGIEGNQEHVVDRCQRPDQDDDAEHYRAGFSNHSPKLVPPVRRTQARQGAGHHCTSVVWSLCIRMITIGISTGSADITAATPSAGLARSKA